MSRLRLQIDTNNTLTFFIQWMNKSGDKNFLIVLGGHHGEQFKSFYKNVSDNALSLWVVWIVVLITLT